MKHVQFNDTIQKRKYKPEKPVSIIQKLSRRQQKKSKKLQQRNSITSEPNNRTYSPPMKSMNVTEEKPMTALHSQDLISWECSQDESSDDEDD